MSRHCRVWAAGVATCDARVFPPPHPRPSQVRQLSNKNWRFVYAASPVGGLDVLLSQWPAIRAAIVAAGGGGERGPSLEILYLFDAQLDARHGGSKWYEERKARV